MDYLYKIDPAKSELIEYHDLLFKANFEPFMH